MDDTPPWQVTTNNARYPSQDILFPWKNDQAVFTKTDGTDAFFLPDFFN